MSNLIIKAYSWKKNGLRFFPTASSIYVLPPQKWNSHSGLPRTPATFSSWLDFVFFIFFIFSTSCQKLCLLFWLPCMAGRERKLRCSVPTTLLADSVKVTSLWNFQLISAYFFTSVIDLKAFYKKCLKTSVKRFLRKQKIFSAIECVFYSVILHENV